MPHDGGRPQQTSQILANARLVLADELIRGALVIEEGTIVAVDQGRGTPRGALDCEGDMLAPGLVAKEKRYALAFVAVSLPLFLTGTALGYFVWPKGIEVLLSFTPKDQDITNILDVANFLSMEIKVMLVFGLSFLLPVVVVGLNMAGVVRGYQLKKARKGVVFGAVVLSAVATPTTDPFSMMALGVPIVGMFLIAEVICRAWDKKRGISEETAEEFAIDLEDGK